MSAAENAVVSSDAYVREILRAAEGESVSFGATTLGASTMDRRSFFKVAGMAGGGLVLAFYMGDRSFAEAATEGKKFAPNAFLSINPDGVDHDSEQGS